MIKDNVGYLIYVTQVQLSKAFNRSIHRILPGVTGVQFTILIYLYYCQSKIVTQREVTDYLHLKHPTVRHIVKLLLKKQLIISGPLPTDHRQVQLMISNRGQKMITDHLSAINHDFKQMNGLITDHLSSREVHVFKDCLKQMIRNFEG